MKNICLFFAVLICHTCHSQPAVKYTYSKTENSLLWEVSGKNIVKPSFLFGTIHLMCKEDILTGKNLQLALKNADEVYFEIDLDDMSNTLGALFFMNMKNDTTLYDLYTPAQLKKVESFFNDSLNMPMGFLKKMKPLLLQALLYPKMMPCKSMMGVEQVLMKLARESSKEIKGLETMAFQASIFDSIPYSVQARELLKGIDSISTYKKSFDSLIIVYKSQNLENIEKLFTNKEFGVGENQAILLDNRNINWVTQLKNLLNKKGLFIAVGAAHLVGKKGLISLLRNEGYIVKPVENN